MALPWHTNFSFFPPPNPSGSLPKWVVNKVSQYLVPQVSGALPNFQGRVPSAWLQHGAAGWGHPWVLGLCWERAP